MRLVLDTNIVVSGLIWGGVPRQLLDLAWHRQVSLFTSSKLLAELSNVLERDKFAALLASRQLTPSFLMQRYGMLTGLVKPYVIKRIARDPDDDLVIATAIAADAELIVSSDRDLLVLHPYRHIAILNPANALQHLAL